MARLERPRKSTQGRKADPTIAAGSRRARGRIVDAAPPPTSRYGQLVALMGERDLKFGDRLAAFNGEVDLSDADLALLALASDYSSYEQRTPRRDRPALFTTAELAAVAAGTGPKVAPWKTLDPR